jgi:hypothetical protein
MKTKRFITVFVLALLVPSSLSYAQYWGERVLEKGFEQTDFFFAPNYLMPYGILSISTVERTICIRLGILFQLLLVTLPPVGWILA